MMTRAECLQTIRRQTDTVLLSFSGGKDSLVCWLALREAGFIVVPFYMQMIPGLGFVERTLCYYEEWFGAHIYRVLHPNLYHWMRTHAYQPVSRHAALVRLDLPRFDYGDVNRGVSRTAGMSEQGWCAVGTRMVDSPMRRAVMERMGPINVATKTFSPIFDMRKQDLIDALRQSGIKLSQDYHDFGRSFDGIDYRYLKPIRDRYPDDYAIIAQWFPYAKLAFVRHAIAERSVDARLTAAV